MHERLLFEFEIYFCHCLLISYYLANSCFHFCIPSRMIGYKIVELSDGYWKFSQSKDIGG